MGCRINPARREGARFKKTGDEPRVRLARSGTGCVMGWLHSEARKGLCLGILGLAAVAAAALVITSGAADARYHRRLRVHYVHYVHREARVSHHASAGEYSPPTASIIVDGNSGEVL